MKHVYFVRHGETDVNASPVIHSSPTNPLNERGHAQAEFIAARCTKLPLEVLISSPFTRARQTAEHIAQKTGLQPIESDLFGECQFISMYWDKPRSEESAHALKEINDHWGDPDFHVSDEENFKDINERAQKALAFLAIRPEEQIGVVTHGLFLRHIVGKALFGDLYTPEMSNIFVSLLRN